MRIVTLREQRGIRMCLGSLAMGIQGVSTDCHSAAPTQETGTLIRQNLMSLAVIQDRVSAPYNRHALSSTPS
jgi:hypothetical protein